MGRGQTTLFDNLFAQQSTASEKKARQTTSFHEMLAHRYYYFAQIKLLRYDFCLQELAKETFRSPETIIDILSDARHVVSAVVENKPGVKQLRLKYPWLTWEA